MRNLSIFNYKSILILIIILTLNSCYTFSGASIHPDAKTIQISTFLNRSTYFNPAIAQEFTINLQDRFIQRTSLSLVNSPADMNINGEIVSYLVSSVNIQSGNSTTPESATQNRLTMNVQVRYESKLEPEKSFQKTFSDYEDFGADLTESQAFNQLAPNLNKKLIDQIFNAIAVDW